MADLFKDIISSLNVKDEHKIDVDPGCEKDYVPFVVNKNFSQSMETVLIANMVNGYPHMDNKLQYDFYYYYLTKAKRFNKWSKKTDDDKLELIMETMGYSRQKALQIYEFIDDLSLEKMKRMKFTG